MNSTIIVSACNDAYLDLMDGMLSSLGCKLNEYDLGVIDVGLTEMGRARIRRHKPNVKFVNGEWRRTFPGISNAPEYKKYVTSKPFIPQTFPGYTGYLYVDSDIWFPDPTAVDDYINAGKETGAAFTFEAHPGYMLNHKIRKTEIFGRTFIHGIRDYFVNENRILFGSSIAAYIGTRARLNGGMFFISANSSIWKSYKDIILDANFSWKNRKIIRDQASLFLAVIKQKHPYTIMSPIYNWFPSLSAPLVDAETFTLLDVAYPHVPIKVIHLTVTKTAGFDLNLTNGLRIRTSGDWFDFLRLREQHLKNEPKKGPNTDKLVSS